MVWHLGVRSSAPQPQQTRFYSGTPCCLQTEYKTGKPPPNPKGGFPLGALVTNSRHGVAAFTTPATSLKLASRLVPAVLAPPITTREMIPAIKAYSIEVTPLFSARNFLKISTSHSPTPHSLNSFLYFQYNTSGNFVSNVSPSLLIESFRKKEGRLT